MRIDSLDILKGIGIILVVVGHMIGNQLYIRPWMLFICHCFSWYQDIASI